MADPTNPAVAGAAQGGQTGVTAPGSGSSPSDPTDPLAVAQAQVDAALARLNDTGPNGYLNQQKVINGQIAEITKTGDSTFAPRIPALQAQLNWINTQQDNDRQLARDVGIQISQEKDRRIKEAHQPGAQPRTAEQNAADQAQAEYYRAQADKITRQDAAQKTQDDYQAAIDQGMPTEEVNRRKIAADDAQKAADAADLVVKQATAAVAPIVAAANASGAVSDATVKAAEASHADEVVVAALNQSVAAGNLSQAQSARILALLQSEREQAGATLESTRATTAKTTLDTEQERLGALNTYIDQLQQGLDAGRLTEAQANQQLYDFEQGSTAFDRQKQRELNMQHATDTALQYGIAVQPNQQYLPGGAPGGGYQAAFAQLGVQYDPVELHPQPLVQQMQAQGFQTAEQAPPDYFGAQGAPMLHAATAAPLLPVTTAGPNDPAPAGHEAAVQQQPFVQPGAQAGTPVAIPTAAVPVAPASDTTKWTMAGHEASAPPQHWHGTKGLAMGGTAYVPPALLHGGALRVSKPPLFAQPAASSGSKPRLFGPSEAQTTAHRRAKRSLFTAA